MQLWLDSMEGAGGIVHYKNEHQLFRNALKRRITECLLVDDGALLASTRSRAVNVHVVSTYQQVGKNFGCKRPNKW